MEDSEMASSTAARTAAPAAAAPSFVAQLFMHEPMSAAALSEASGWHAGGTNIAFDTVIHRDMAEAPPAARTTAERISKALDGATLPASESDTVGRAVVIVGAGNVGLPDKAALLAALGLKNQVVHEAFNEVVNLLQEANLTPRNYAQYTAGFCHQPDDRDVIDDDDEDWRKIMKTTAIMVTDLRDHFELNFSEEIVAAPVLFGGRASDGHIVAVLSMRVWT